MDLVGYIDIFTPRRKIYIRIYNLEVKKLKKTIRVIAAALVFISLALPVSAKEEASFGQTVGLGDGHCLAIKADGSLWAWGGSNQYGEIGDGTDTMYQTGKIISDEEIKRTWALFPKKVLENVREVSAGSNYSMAIKNDGSLWAWGYNLSGVFGNGRSSDFVNFDNNSNVPIKIMDNVATVSCGPSHVLAVKTDGSLWSWGANNRGQLGDGTNKTSYVPKKIMDNAVAACAGAEFSMAVKADGSLWSWGCNYWGILGNGKETLYEDVNNDSNIPIKIMDDVIAVDAGEEHTFAIKRDRSLWAWGHNRNGKLGNGKEDGKVLTPVKVMDNVKSAGAYLHNSLVIKEDLSLWTWGYNYSGQLGNGTRKDSHIPVKIMDNVVAIGTGVFDSYFMAVKKDGSLWGWGNNSGGQLGNGEFGFNSDSTVPLKVLDGVAFPDEKNIPFTFPEPSSQLMPAVPINSRLVINGKAVSLKAYNITGNNYFKLRDLAAVLSGTEKQFDVTFDNGKNAINLISNKPYPVPYTETVTVSDMNTGNGAQQEASLNTSKIYIDGIEVKLTAYTINGSNYFKLRDIGHVFNIGITWDGQTNSIVINTAEGYSLE